MKWTVAESSSELTSQLLMLNSCCLKPVRLKPLLPHPLAAANLAASNPAATNPFCLKPLLPQTLASLLLGYLFFMQMAFLDGMGFFIFHFLASNTGENAWWKHIVQAQCKQIHGNVWYEKEPLLPCPRIPLQQLSTGIQACRNDLPADHQSRTKAARTRVGLHASWTRTCKAVEAAAMKSEEWEGGRVRGRGKHGGNKCGHPTVSFKGAKWGMRLCALESLWCQ
eukprot:scaffold9566_cov19-Tisochrysis_lutea.AAC.2